MTLLSEQSVDLLKLLDLLQTEHAIVQVLIQEIVAAGLASFEGKEKLFLAEELLINHLEREEMILYPLLNELAEDHLPIQEVVQNLREESISLSIHFLSFSQKLHSGISTDSLQPVFENLLVLLQNRIDQEDRQLYHLVRTYCQLD